MNSNQRVNFKRYKRHLDTRDDVFLSEKSRRSDREEFEFEVRLILIVKF